MRPEAAIAEASESELQAAAAVPVRAPSSHVGRLVLTPTDPHCVPSANLMVEALRREGFLDSSAEDADEILPIGPGFLSLLSFTGCAVTIGDEPGADGGYCFVRVSPAHAYPVLQAGRNTRPPRCVGCRGRLLDWQDRTKRWRLQPHAGVKCPSCSEIRPPWLWDWKQQGGFGRFFIEVEGVFPGEATPTPTLFEHLTRASGTGWRHFYVQD